jgi:hypothetical protein
MYATATSMGILWAHGAPAPPGHSYLPAGPGPRAAGPPSGLSYGSITVGRQSIAVALASVDLAAGLDQSCLEVGIPARLLLKSVKD